jgi:HK97 family phage prohead protease
MTDRVFRVATGLIETVEQDDAGVPRYVSGYASKATLDVDQYLIPPDSWSLTHFNHILLWNHDRDRPIGRTFPDKVKADDIGLFVERGELDLTHPLAKQEAESMRRGFPRGFSVGFKAIDKPEITQDGITVFRRNALLEISIVTVPANVGARPTLTEADEETMVQRMVASVERAAFEAIVSKASQTMADVVEQRLAEINVEHAAAEAVEKRIGTVRELAEKAVEKRLAVEKQNWEMEQRITALEDMVTRPFPSEHACRLRDPGEFVRFRRDNSKDPNLIIGFRKDGSSDLQSMRYPTSRWSAEKARAHCREHDGSFEAASKEK